MGTNFYFGSNEGPHIGKRSAAGLFCWDCGVTLCKGGKSAVHHHGYGHHDCCPKCGKEKTAGGGNRSASIELGFAKPCSERPAGVGSCSSFRWAMSLGEFLEEARSRDVFVVDEYGRRLDPVDFLEMLVANCPLQYTDAIGREFS